MVSWPGTIKPGMVSDYAWAFWDFLPTAAELAGGIEIPKDLDGVSIVPTLLGKPQPPKDYLFWTWRGTGCAMGWSLIDLPAFRSSLLAASQSPLTA